MTLSNAVLQEIYATGQVQDQQGQTRPLSSHISQAQGQALYRMVRDLKPTELVEVGLAAGMSALPMLTALQEHGAGTLTSIDPNQSSDWEDIAVSNIERAGLANYHRLVERPDFHALPALLEEKGRSVEFAFIDGWHTFDYVLLDFFYIDKMLQPGGVVAFDDVGMAAVRKVLRYVTSHRHYEEMDVLPPAYEASNPAKALVRRAMGWRTGNRYFRKLDDWEPPWNFYARF